MRSAFRQVIQRPVIALGLIALALVIPTKSHAAAPQPRSLATERPNIVLILADDLDMSLVGLMPNLRRLQANGVTFNRSFVADSLCCPSRASTFTGMFPHNTGVRTNASDPGDPSPQGGYPAFKAVENRSFAVSLHNAGYYTGFMGKYMNEYPVKAGGPIPSGWDEWNPVSGGGYQGWHYAVGRIGQDAQGVPTMLTDRYDDLSDRYYVQTELGYRAAAFIHTAESSASPYFLEVAPYGTHARIRPPAHPGDPRFPPALRDLPSTTDADGNCGGNSQTDCASLSARQLVGFDQPTSDNRPFYADGHRRLGWLPEDPLSVQQIRAFSRHLRNRARMAQAVDRIIGQVMAASASEPTYLFFTSDNGFRLGQFRLSKGKGTPYTPDINVPLVVGGSALPVNRAGASRNALVENIDLAPTFDNIAGVTPPQYIDGVSLLPLIDSAHRIPWRHLAFIEHTRPPPRLDDPDHENSTGMIPTYWAVRSGDALFVHEYKLTSSGQWVDLYEYYTGLSAPGAFEQTNVYRPGDPQMEEMRRQLADYRTCGGLTCRTLAVR